MYKYKFVGLDISQHFVVSHSYLVIIVIITVIASSLITTNDLLALSNCSYSSVLLTLIPLDIECMLFSIACWL